MEIIFPPNLSHCRENGLKTQIDTGVYCLCYDCVIWGKCIYFSELVIHLKKKFSGRADVRMRIKWDNVSDNMYAGDSSCCFYCYLFLEGERWRNVFNLHDAERTLNFDLAQGWGLQVNSVKLAVVRLRKEPGGTRERRMHMCEEWIPVEQWLWFSLASVFQWSDPGRLACWPLNTYSDSPVLTTVDYLWHMLWQSPSIWFILSAWFLCFNR